MTQNIETTSFFERFQKPMTRRAAMVTFSAAMGAAALTILPNFVKMAAPQLNRTQPAEEPNENVRPTRRGKEMITRHPGPEW